MSSRRRKHGQNKAIAAIVSNTRPRDTISTPDRFPRRRKPRYTAPAMLTLNDITYRLGERLLLDRASAFLPTGSRVGLVGRNGTGKTTLFRIVTGDLSPEGGNVALPRGMRIGGVAQEAPGGPERLIDVVLAADTERAALIEEAQSATDPMRIAEIETRLADIGAHSAPARAATVLHGLGFDEEAQQRPCSDFSGGWRMRVALAAVLFSEPDLLLLDEPTNYLDLEGTLWLYDYLERYPHTVLVVSHDRELLDTCVDHILHLDQGKLTIYRGGYSDFERLRARSRRISPGRARSRMPSASICKPSSTASGPRPPRRARRSRGSSAWRRCRRSRSSRTATCSPSPFQLPSDRSRRR